jgi:hypothetical protein
MKNFPLFSRGFNTSIPVYKFFFVIEKIHKINEFCPHYTFKKISKVHQFVFNDCQSAVKKRYRRCEERPRTRARPGTLPGGWRVRFRKSLGLLAKFRNFREGVRGDGWPWGGGRWVALRGPGAKNRLAGPPRAGRQVRPWGPVWLCVTFITRSQRLPLLPASAVLG